MAVGSFLFLKEQIKGIIIIWPRPEDAHADAHPPSHPHASPYLTNND